MVSWRRLEPRPLTEYDGDSVDTSPGRSLDTSFQPNEFRPTLVIYTVSGDCDGDDTLDINLLSDSADPPTTTICRGQWGNSESGTAVLVHLVPPGHFVEIETSATGDPTSSLDVQTEITL